MTKVEIKIYKVVQLHKPCKTGQLQISCYDLPVVCLTKITRIGSHKTKL